MITSYSIHFFRGIFPEVLSEVSLEGFLEKKKERRRLQCCDVSLLSFLAHTSTSTSKWVCQDLRARTKEVQQKNISTENTALLDAHESRVVFSILDSFSTSTSTSKKLENANGTSREEKINPKTSQKTSDHSKSRIAFDPSTNKEKDAKKTFLKKRKCSCRRNPLRLSRRDIQLLPDFSTCFSKFLSRKKISKQILEGGL